jgi:hypothetical protein
MTIATILTATMLAGVALADTMTFDNQVTVT